VTHDTPICQQFLTHTQPNSFAHFVKKRMGAAKKSMEKDQPEPKGELNKKDSQDEKSKEDETVLRQASVMKTGLKVLSHPRIKDGVSC